MTTTLDSHVVTALDVRDAGDIEAGIAPTSWVRSYVESQDEAFRLYQQAQAAGLEVRAEQVRHRSTL